MDIYRVMPTAVTPPRQTVSRRERESHERRDGAEREPTDKSRDAPPSAAAADENHADVEVAEEQGKGRRLNVSA